jgi:hypothetical protein
MRKPGRTCSPGCARATHDLELRARLLTRCGLRGWQADGVMDEDFVGRNRTRDSTHVFALVRHTHASASGAASSLPALVRRFRRAAAFCSRRARYAAILQRVSRGGGQYIALR